MTTVILPLNGDWETLKKLGVIKGEPLPYRRDRYGEFCHAEVPQGWEKVPSNHWALSELKDASGTTIATLRQNPCKEPGYAQMASFQVSHEIYKNLSKEEENDEKKEKEVEQNTPTQLEKKDSTWHLFNWLKW